MLVLAAAGIYFYARESLPQMSGTIGVAGASAPISIVRDRNAVPHIYAQSRNDANFGLGYVHAQDRLWQMEVNRRIASGRISEVVGSSTVNTDRFLRTLGLRRAAELSLPKLDSETRTALDAYTAGINAFITNHSGPLPPEFMIFRFQPDLWTPVDVLAWGKIMAWQLSGNWPNELARMRLAKQLSAQQVQEFMAPYPGDAPVALSDQTGLYRQAAADMDLDRLAALAPPSLPEGMGSNNWVVTGARTITGKPLLANDPHLGFAAPAVWYFAHLSAPGLDAIGATLPGIPAIILGHNRTIAWGFTNTAPDTQDLYIEKIDPANPNNYIAPDGPRPFDMRNETIRVKDGDDIVLPVRSTRHGPVISDVNGQAREAVEAGMALAFAWPVLRDDDLTANALLRLPQANDWAGFVEALRDYHSPQQNMVYADTDGNIGFLAPGRVPIRKPEHETRGLAPASGWDARNDWIGFIPFDQLPMVLNPRSGKVVTANQKIVTDAYPYYLTSEWAEPYRARRIETMLAARPLHSIDSFKQIQGDVISTMTTDFLPLLLAAPVDPADPDLQAAHDRLAAWDGAAVMDLAEPLIFEAWMRELGRLVAADELGPYFELLWRSRPVFLYNVLTDRNGQSRWCDDINTPARETCADMISRSLALAIADLKARYGQDMARWRWGEVHVARNEHQPFSNVPVLRDLFEIRVESPGTTYSVDVGRNDISDPIAPYTSTHGPSMRAIYDLSNLDQSVYRLATGQSGNVLSPYYRNQAEAWAAVEYLPLSTRKADIESGSLGSLVLAPR